MWQDTTPEQREQNPYLEERVIKSVGMVPAFNLKDATEKVAKLGERLKLCGPVASVRDSGEQLLA